MPFMFIKNEYPYLYKIFTCNVDPMINSVPVLTTMDVDPTAVNTRTRQQCFVGSEQDEMKGWHQRHRGETRCYTIHNIEYD